jgi:hypothetical protein
MKEHLHKAYPAGIEEYILAVQSHDALCTMHNPIIIYLIDPIVPPGNLANSALGAAISACL